MQYHAFVIEFHVNHEISVRIRAESSGILTACVSNRPFMLCQSLCSNFSTITNDIADERTASTEPPIISSTRLSPIRSMPKGWRKDSRKIMVMAIVASSFDNCFMILYAITAAKVHRFLLMNEYYSYIISLNQCISSLKRELHHRMVTIHHSLLHDSITHHTFATKNNEKNDDFISSCRHGDDKSLMLQGRNGISSR